MEPPMVARVRRKDPVRMSASPSWPFQRGRAAHRGQPQRRPRLFYLRRREPLPHSCGGRDPSPNRRRWRSLPSRYPPPRVVIGTANAEHRRTTVRTSSTLLGGKPRRRVLPDNSMHRRSTQTAFAKSRPPRRRDAPTGRATASEPCRRCHHGGMVAFSIRRFREEV